MTFTTSAANGAKINRLLILCLFSSFLTAQNTNPLWQKTNGPGTNMVRDMALFNNMLYAGTEGGIYKSSDNGNSWTFTSGNIPYRGLYHLLATSQALISGSQNGIYRSADGGASWNRP